MTKRPNVLLILTDQQNFRMMSCTGNRFVRTPAMDSLTSEVVRFNRAYCTNPVCVPSRFSLFSGRMPTEIGQRSNSTRGMPAIPERIPRAAMGHLFRKAGYQVVYGGKQHFPKMTAEDLGFDVLCKDERDALAEKAAAFVRARHDRPFLLVASFINPHDICYMGIRDHPASDFDRLLVRKGKIEIAALDEALKRPDGVGEAAFWRDHCPPLPGNSEPQPDEPEPITDLVRGRPFRQFIRGNWTKEEWRLHRWAYRRLTERVDAQIGRVLKALRSGPSDRDTIVVFTSDHGDHDGSHRMEHKGCLYEEAARIPLIVRVPGGKAGAVDEHLVSNGLDLLPTLCDYAGIDAPDDLIGRSLRPLIDKGPAPAWREHLRLESQVGLGVVTERYKYVLHDYGQNREQLYDLKRDPGETRSFAGDADCRDALAVHRRLYQQCFADSPAAAKTESSATG